MNQREQEPLGMNPLEGSYCNPTGGRAALTTKWDGEGGWLEYLLIDLEGMREAEVREVSGVCGWRLVPPTLTGKRWRTKHKPQEQIRSRV